MTNEAIDKAIEELTTAIRAANLAYDFDTSHELENIRETLAVAKTETLQTRLDNGQPGHKS